MGPVLRVWISLTFMSQINKKNVQDKQGTVTKKLLNTQLNSNRENGERHRYTVKLKMQQQKQGECVRCREGLVVIYAPVCMLYGFLHSTASMINVEIISIFWSQGLKYCSRFIRSLQSATLH